MRARQIRLLPYPAAVQTGLWTPEILAVRLEVRGLHAQIPFNVKTLTLRPRISIRRLCGGHGCDYDCTGVCDASPITKTKLLVPQRGVGGDRAIPPISEAERERWDGFRG